MAAETGVRVVTRVRVAVSGVRVADSGVRVCVGDGDFGCFWKVMQKVQHSEPASIQKLREKEQKYKEQYSQSWLYS